MKIQTRRNCLGFAVLQELPKTLACPEIRQRVQIFGLIKSIGLCDSINTENFLGPLRHILTPPYHAEVSMSNLLDIRISVWLGRGVNILTEKLIVAGKGKFSRNLSDGKVILVCKFKPWCTCTWWAHSSVSVTRLLFKTLQNVFKRWSTACK